MAYNAKRDQIVTLKTADLTNKELMEYLMVCRKTINCALKQFHQSGTTSGKLIPDTTHMVRTKTMISATKKKMEWNQQESIEIVAKYPGISRYSMRRVIVDDLQLTTYKKPVDRVNFWAPEA